jgi:hypothetical protein
MSATHGSTRRLGRTVACCLAALIAAFALAAGADAKTTVPTKTYLALGDSLAFGAEQKIFNEHWAEGDPASYFEQGYANRYLRQLEGHNEYQLTNLACPGETSKSFIGSGAVGKALESSWAATTEKPCPVQEVWNAYHKNGTGEPLHTPYVGRSQLEAALEMIAADAAAGRPVSVVTLDMGANDQIKALQACEKEVTKEFETEGKSKYGSTPAGAFNGCLVSHVPGVIKTIITNTEAAGYALRHGAEFGGINYTGKIVFVTAYDPYGSVFKRGEELLSGSTALASLIDGQQESHFSQGFDPEKEEAGFEACIVNTLPVFNPGRNAEPTRLQKWTNMATFTETEVEPGVKKADGPDIHPTPAGYAKIARLIADGCGR